VGCMGATPTNPTLATSRSTRTTVLTRGLCVYDPPCRSTAPWRAGITAEGFDTPRVFAAPLPRAVASISGCMGAAPTNPILATSNSTQTTVLTRGLCVYDPPCRSTAPWRAGITAEGFDTSRVFAAPLPRAVASIVGCMGATPTNPTLATSSSTRTTVLTWGLCVYDPPC
jgi:hypothetical protein